MKSFNLYLLRSSLVAALGGLLFGFDTAVIAGTTRALTATYGLSPATLGVTVSMALWGTVLGSLLAATPSDRYGRKACLAALGLLYIVSALGCAWSPNGSFSATFASLSCGEEFCPPANRTFDRNEFSVSPVSLFDTTTECSLAGLFAG